MEANEHQPQNNFIEKRLIDPIPPKKNRGRLFLFVAIAILLLGFSVTRAVMRRDVSEDPLAYDPISLEPKKPEGLLKRIKHFIFSKDVTLEGQRDDRINILLLGMGGPGHDGPYLTDTIIIASIQPSTGQIGMVSIPRDLGVNVPGSGWRKINSANALGEAKKKNWGAAFTTEVIEKTFDIDIHYYTRVDFKAFEEIIDEVGGININVDRSFTDAEYPAPNDQYRVVSFTKGVHVLDGEDALIYARSRHGNNGEGSDFARAKRQQKVLLALKEKILSVRTLANPVHIYNITKSLDAHLTTNMAFSDIIALLKMSRELDTNNINTVVLDNSSTGHLQNGYSPNGAFILEPKTGNFDEISELINNIFETSEVAKNDTPAQDTEDPAIRETHIEVQNGTWRAGLAARVREQLRKEQFTISTIGNTQKRPQMTSGIYTVSENLEAGILDSLKDELGIPIKKISSDFKPSTSTDILIILGEDYGE